MTPVSRRGGEGNRRQVESQIRRKVVVNFSVERSGAAG